MYFFSNAPALTLLALRRRECAFHFVEIQSDILIIFCRANQSINTNIFSIDHTHVPKIFVRGYCDYSLLRTIFMFSGNVVKLNIL